MLLEVWDWNAAGRDDFLGWCSLELSSLSQGVSHNLWRALEGGQGHINLLLTVRYCRATSSSLASL